VVVVSTEASETRIRELKENGIKGFVHKPFTPEMIRDVVTEILGACHAGN
jgi:two-component system chemotaxis response regulator CheY